MFHIGQIGQDKHLIPPSAVKYLLSYFPCWALALCRPGGGIWVKKWSPGHGELEKNRENRKQKLQGKKFHSWLHGYAQLLSILGLLWRKLTNSGYKEILKCIWILRHYKGILGHFPEAQCNCGAFLLILCKSCKIITWGKEWCYLVFISASVSAHRDYPEKFSRTFLARLYFNCCIKIIFPLMCFFIKFQGKQISSTNLCHDTSSLSITTEVLWKEDRK